MTTTLDQLLNGQVSLRQSRDGYRAGMDAVFLAASLQARPGDTLIEFGCGPGAALLCAASRLQECNFIGVEVDPDAVALATENTALNTMDDRISVETGSVSELKFEARAQQVFFNPPYFDDASALRAPKPEKTRAWLTGDAPLVAWVDAAAKTLLPKGRLSLIHRADKLDDILAALSPRFGSVVIKPVQPRADKAAKRILVTARLGGKAPLALLPALILHDDGPAPHTPQAEAILRGQAVIDMTPSTRSK
jgi:tRNA1(Val) A37 N6-methylase TrmN6